VEAGVQQIGAQRTASGSCTRIDPNRVTPSRVAAWCPGVQAVPYGPVRNRTYACSPKWNLNSGISTLTPSITKGGSRSVNLLGNGVVLRISKAYWE
jgi:hypothetical protein